MTDTPQGRSETNEATGEIRTFDPTKPFTTRDGMAVSDFRWHEHARDFSGHVEGYGVTIWSVAGRSNRSANLDLVNAPPPVSGGGSTCDRPTTSEDEAVLRLAPSAACHLCGRDTPHEHVAYRCPKCGNNRYEEWCPYCDTESRDDVRPGQADAAVAEADTIAWRCLATARKIMKSFSDGKLSMLETVDMLKDFLSEVEIPEAALRAAVPRELEGWQPIETAPKDGTRVLIYREGVVHIAQWISGWGGTWGSVVERIPGEQTTFTDLGQIGWQTIIAARGPSHWRPLPAPPTAAPSKATGEGDRKAQVQADQMKHALSYGHRAPTAAAPSPGREDESDAAFVDRVAERRMLVDLEGDDEPKEFKRLIALARREPTRLEGGVTEAQVEAAKNACDVCVSRSGMRAALEAAASAAPSDAGGKEGRS